MNDRLVKSGEHLVQSVRDGLEEFTLDACPFETPESGVVKGMINLANGQKYKGQLLLDSQGER